jgi:flagellar hook-length control protein FliK
MPFLNFCETTKKGYAMQALDFQIDMKLASAQLKQDFQTAVQGLNSGYQDGTSFRKMLEEAQSENTTEGKNINEKPEEQVLEKTASVKDSRESAKLDKDSSSVSKLDDKSVEEKQDDSEGVYQKITDEEKEATAELEIKNKKSFELQDFFAVAEEDADIPELVTELSDDVALYEEDEQAFSTDEILVAVMTGASVPKNTEKIKPQVILEEQSVQEITEEKAVSNLTGKLGEEISKNKKLSDEDGKINVLDLRTENVEKSEEKLITKEAAKEGKFVSSVSKTDDSQITFTYSNAMEQGNASVNVDVDASSVAVSEGKDFSNMLADKIENQAAELVKSGTLVLKDGGKGTINLILHPEKLGNVKVKLEMSENIITGKIVVQSEEAYNALKTSLPVLKAAFSESGFDTAGFDLSWAGNHNNGGSEQSDKNPQWFKYAEDQMKVFDSDFADFENSAAYGNNFYGNSRISVVA